MSEPELCDDIPDGDYYSELVNIAALFEEPGKDKWKRMKRRITMTIATQNLRGFASKSRRKWMSGWRRYRGRRQPDMVLLQETAIRSDPEEKEVEKAWQRTWQITNSEHPLSYWAQTRSKSAGVGILVSPELSKNVRPWKQNKWTPRIMAVTLKGWLIINVYAPAVKKERAAFFHELEPWIEGHEAVILGGDFNCVLRPNQDRVVDKSPSGAGCESPELERLLDKHELTDAIDLNRDLDTDEEEVDPLQHFTFWRKNSASRLDRFYVKGEPFVLSQWVEVVDPAHSSDHQEVRLELTSRDKTTPGNRAQVYYPILSGRPQRIKEIIAAKLVSLIEEFEKCDQPVKRWDGLVENIQLLLLQTKKTDRQQTQRYFERLRKETRKTRSSRKEIMEDRGKMSGQRAARSFGQRLAGGPEEVRRFFKRNSDWQRDQYITAIEPTPGHFYDEKYPTEERMASEWSHIFASSHATQSPQEMDRCLNQYVDVPNQQRVTASESSMLVAEITEWETGEAIQALKRHKTAGTTGLNHDFYKDFGDLLTPSLTMLYNAILRGEGVPQSFLKATIVPLRKNGDSRNAMDYRPISLLNTAYKIFGRVLAERLHRLLPKIVSSSQQGFVRGRNIDKTVTMLRRVLRKSTKDSSKQWQDSEGILCLDFRKAYDTLDRTYLMKVLRRYGFTEKFLNVIRQLHDGTTAQFQVNGQISKEWGGGVNSGIRQGCPLAPLLFILAADVLSKAINQHQKLKGAEIDGAKGHRHKFSAFVDDSTVFMSSIAELEVVKTILVDFGNMSGLHVQNQKSVLIGLNTRDVPHQWNGFPVLDPQATTRQLGYWVGNRDTTMDNWDIRIGKIQRRLRVATTMSNSVSQRITLFNVVALPSILYTGKQFLPSKEVLTKLENLQKQFVWLGRTKTTSTRHKLNPALIFAPKNYGGLGLQDIQQALQTTRSNVAAKWVEGEKDEYTVAWHELAHPGQRCEQSRCIFQPTTGRMVKKLLREKRSVPTATAQEVGIAELWEAHSEGVVPGEEEREQTMKIIAEGPARSSSYQLDELHVCFSTQKKQNNWLSATSLQFLKTTTWHDNGSIINEQGKELTKREFPEIRPARLQEIKVQVETEPTMTGEHVAVILVPMKEGKKLQNHFRQAAKWCRNVLLSIPWQVWQQEQTTIEPIGIPKLMSRLRWIQGRNSREVVAEQEVNGQWSEVLQIEKNANELSWRIKRVEAQFQQSEDFATMEEWIFLKGIAIKANPLTAEYPWRAQQGIHADNLNFNIRKQRSRYFKKQSGYNKKAVRDKLEKYEKTSKWGKAAMTQSPQQMWKRQGIFTDYQNWTIYRMAVGSLNLFHAGWPEYQDCPDFECQCTQETPDHIIWECDKAQAAWIRWMGKWLGYTPSIEDRQSLMHHAAARLAPHPTTQFIAKARGFTARWYKDHEEAMAMIWLIWSTVTPVLLWRLRNKAVFDGKISTTEETQDIILGIPQNE